MDTSIFAILAVALLGCAQAQINFPGPCQEVQVKPNFDKIAYQGIWYEYSKYTVTFEKDRKCIQGELTLQPKGNYTVKNSGVNTITNATSSTVGVGVPVENAKLKIIFPTSRPTNATSNYWVVDTNYSDYSMVYNCVDQENGTHNAFAWILTRNRTYLSPEYLDHVYAVFRKYNISTDALTKTIQYPECDAFFPNQ